MKIWIDIRNASKNKNNFTKDLVDYLVWNKKENLLNIYADKWFEVEWKIVQEAFSTFWWEQTLFLQQLKKDKNDVIFSFEETFPIWYSGEVILVIPSLETILYPDIENTKLLKKYSHLYTIKKNLKNAKKIVCFTESTQRELNEKLNISEEKIVTIAPFFPSSKEIKLTLDIKAKLGIQWDYFIYDYNYYSNNNLKRVLEAIKEIAKQREIYLVILGSKNANNREIRELILSLDISKNILFAGTPDGNELGCYYKESLGVIYPIIYDNFPMTLHHALNYNTPILASDNTETRNIFGESITYFSPISVSSMVKNITTFLDAGKKVPNYESVKNKYNISDFYNNLISIIR